MGKIKIYFYTFTLFMILADAGTFFAQEKNDTFKTVFGLVSGLDSLNLKTGDLLLFQSMTFDGIMTQIGTKSPYTHSAIVIKNPDGSLYLTHATDNYYNGDRIKVIEEDKGRPGVILTKIEDSFLSVDKGKTGFYKHIWIRRFDENWVERPNRDTLLNLYKKYKNKPFTKSKYPFIFAGLDFIILGKDLLSLPDNESFICSEYVLTILIEAGIPISCDQKKNEYTPKDIRNLEPYFDSKPIVFIFEDGNYRLK